MQGLLSAYEYLKTNGPAMLAAFFGLWGGVEVIVRLTPTKKDDTALERVGKVIKNILDAFKIPNNMIIPTVIEDEANKAAELAQATAKTTAKVADEVSKMEDKKAA